MRLLLFFCVSLFVCLWGTSALDSHIAVPARQQQASKTRTRTGNGDGNPRPTNRPPQSSSPRPTRTQTPSGSSKSTFTEAPKQKQTGLTRATKIGIGVGVPLGVLRIAGGIAKYVVGKKRRQKRKAYDPTAGAGKRVSDPSAELNIPPATPTAAPEPASGPTAVVELTAVNSNGFEDAQSMSEWWKSPFQFGRGQPRSRSQWAITSPRVSSLTSVLTMEKSGLTR